MALAPATTALLAMTSATANRPSAIDSIAITVISAGVYLLSLTLANFKRAHRLCGTRNIGSFSTIS